MNHSANRRVLISGASIAGPTLAYWLHQYGFEVTVVEKATHVRGGGYPVDVRGTALGVVDRMGLLARLREVRVDTRRVSFVDSAGAPIGTIRPEQVTGGETDRDVEIRRGDLADALYTPIRDAVEFRFGDSIATLTDHGDRVDVVFRGGDRRTFDLVIGADGLHSRTRGLAFGPEETFHHYLGSAFAGFTLPGDLGLAHEVVAWNAPGRAAVLFAQEPGESLHGFLVFTRETPPFDAFRNPSAQRDLVAAMFPERSWEVPRLVAAMREADDLFFDVVSQIRMPAWSAGRVALVGDAAFAPSFLSGQGSSVALVAAYVLAGELARHADHTAAFAAYEKVARPFVERNQALATDGSSVFPTTREALDARDAALRAASGSTPPSGAAARNAVHTSLVLPDYPRPA
ncbi:FAD-dependent monooxygenase [Streptomyces sp. NPDC057702]|uniref:FAD-dependent monooxygenase n=1 Tax=unclassified Streptomyces TaxID=2593676 RepID=UPI0036A2F86D